MQTYNDIQQIDPDKFAAIAAGAFFQFNKNCLQDARRLIRNNQPVLFVDVFPAHSMAELKLLLSASERQTMMADLGADAYIALSMEDFVKFLGNLSARTPSSEQKLTLLCGLSPDKIHPVHAQEFISSAFRQGFDFQWHTTLGYYYPLTGKVVYGNQIGRKMGFPTANLRPDDPSKIIPPLGVYAGWVQIGDKHHASMINIGIRPTLDLENVTIEAHIFNFDENIYNATLTLHFLQRIRNEMKFPSLDELKTQLKQDQETTLQILDKHKDMRPKANFIFHE